jgi:hypothetical protein
MIQFKVKVSIGVVGISLSELQSKGVDGFVMPNPDFTTNDEIIRDIEAWECESWFQYIRGELLSLEPIKEGVYILTGNVVFSDDDSDYSNLSLDKYNEVLRLYQKDAVQAVILAQGKMYEYAMKCTTDYERKEAFEMHDNIMKSTMV